MKAVDLQTTRTSANSTQRKGLVTTSSKVNTGSKKTVSQSKIEQPNQLQVKKSSELKIGLQTQEIDLHNLLKMPEKLGVSSTRHHHNPDFIAKLQN